jgi:hypothetical protein
MRGEEEEKQHKTIVGYILGWCCFSSSWKCATQRLRKWKEE